jgi:hypothetical protein
MNKHEKRDSIKQEIKTIAKLNDEEADRLFKLISYMIEIRIMEFQGQPEQAIEARIRDELI